MIVLVTGDRYWTDYPFILESIRLWHTHIPIRLLIHGACRGADLLADRAAGELGIPRASHPAQWDRDGRAAGPIRNRQMLIEHPDMDLVLGFHDNIESSRGTRDMLRIASGTGILCCLESHRGTVCPWPMMTKK